LAQSDRDKRLAGFDEKPPTPESLKPYLAKAKARTAKRPPSPPISIRRTEEGDAWEWDWPFGDHDGDWQYLVLDAIGTRHPAVAAVFLDQLRRLCSRDWESKDEDWRPDSAQLSSLLAIVASCKPRNEAQAAMAAQMAAVHLMSMRVADRIGERPWDVRMIGAFAKLTRTYAEQMSVMATLNGRNRSTRQKITVKHEKHVHHHQHVHLEGGKGKNGSQPHASTDSDELQESGNPGVAPAEPEISPALLSDDTGGQVVPLRSGEGKACVPNARRKRIGRTDG